MKIYAPEIDYDLIMNRLSDYRLWNIFQQKKYIYIIKKFELTVVPIVIYRYYTSTGHYRGIIMAGYVTM